MYPDQLDLLDLDAEILAGLGTRVKLRIALIARHDGEVMPTDLCLWLTQPGQPLYAKNMMSRHLSELLASRVLVVRPVKQTRLYRLHPTHKADLDTVLSAFELRDYALADRKAYDRLRREGRLLIDHYRDLPATGDQ